MKLIVRRPGMFTTVQDLGRWGFQSSGVPVAGAMDITALRLGNIIVGNEPCAAALEVTFLGPEMEVDGDGLVVFAGAELGFRINGKEADNWTAIALHSGDVISFAGPSSGCRGCLCFAGGVDVPVVMGSRATYTRAKIGGLDGRPLKAGDVLSVKDVGAGRLKLDGFSMPIGMRPDYSQVVPLEVIPGLQEDFFTEAGLAVLFGSKYAITNDSDRMGCRFEGPEVEHKAGADIVSDAIPLGAVQIPGHGRPIVMLADRQTTGGYTKVGVLTRSSTARLVQMAPGTNVRFARASVEQAVAELNESAEQEAELARLACEWIAEAKRPAQGAYLKQLLITVNGVSYNVTCEEI